MLTFQAPFDVKLLRAGIRRLITPMVTSVCAAGVLVAAVIYLAGEHSLAAALAAGSVLTAAASPWYVASEVARRNAHRSGRMVAYRIDRTGVEASEGFATTSLPWSEISRVEQRRDQVALYFGRRSVRTVPTGTLTPEQRAQLQHLLRTRGIATAGPTSAGRQAAPS